MDPVFSRYGYTKIRKNRDPCDTHEPKCAKTTTTPMGSLDKNDHLLATLTKEYFEPNLTVPKYFLYADQMVYLF